MTENNNDYLEKLTIAKDRKDLLSDRTSKFPFHFKKAHYSQLEEKEKLYQENKKAIKQNALLAKIKKEDEKKRMDELKN